MTALTEALTEALPKIPTLVMSMSADVFLLVTDQTEALPRVLTLAGPVTTVHADVLP